jgi:hypothetical protein
LYICNDPLSVPNCLSFSFQVRLALREKDWRGLSKGILLAMVDKPSKQDLGESTSKERKTEYIVIGVLFFAALMAFPAFRDVQLMQEFFISICSGLGLT